MSMHTCKMWMFIASYLPSPLFDQQSAIKNIFASLWGILVRRFLFKGRCAWHYDFWSQSSSTLASSGESKGWLALSSCSPFQHPTHNWASCPRKRGRLSVCESGPGRPESTQGFQDHHVDQVPYPLFYVTITTFMSFLLLLCCSSTWYSNGFVFIFSYNGRNGLLFPTSHIFA